MGLSAHVNRLPKPYNNFESSSKRGFLPVFQHAAEINAMAPDYKKAILWAVQKKITTGYSDNTFRPNRNCTRGECVTFLSRV